MAQENDKALMKAIEDKIHLDDSMFKVKEEDTENQGISGINIEEKPLLSEVEKEMKELGLSKDGVLAIIDALVTNGAYEEEISCLGGRIKFKLKSAKIRNSGDFVKSFSPNEVRTQLEEEFQFNLGTMAMVLVEYNGVSTGDTLHKRMDFLEQNISSPTFKVILKEVFLFGRKMNLIGTDEVADFF